jgi:tetratricopeptide (TPR) repeat protein
MTKNIFYSIAGIVLGFFVGFIVANFGGRQRLGLSATNASSARGANQTQADGQLPPNHPDISNTGGTSAASTNAQAQEAMDAADRNPKDFMAQLQAAVIFYRLNSFDKAKLYVERALAIRPDDPDALVGMGHIKFEMGDYTGAATYYEKVLAQHPNDPDLLTALGNTYARRTPPDYDRAITQFRKALGAEPKNEGALESLADAAIHKGDKATARDAVDKLAAANPSNPALSSLRSKLGG